MTWIQTKTQTDTHTHVHTCAYISDRPYCVQTNHMMLLIRCTNSYVIVDYIIVWFTSIKNNNINNLISGPTPSTRGNLARARARGTGSPRTLEHCYLPH